MSRLIARIAKIIIWVTRPTQYDVKNTGPATSSTNAARMRTTLTSSAALLRTAIQSRRLDREHDRHRREQREVRQLGDQRLAEVVDQADDDAADERAFEAAHAADDHDEERERQ